jgi:hypothetical protein
MRMSRFLMFVFMFSIRNRHQVHSTFRAFTRTLVYHFGMHGTGISLPRRRLMRRRMVMPVFHKIIFKYTRDDFISNSGPSEVAA